MAYSRDRAQAAFQNIRPLPRDTSLQTDTKTTLLPPDHAQTEPLSSWGLGVPASAPRPGDQARVTVTVAVPPAEAFRIFTQDIDLWWRRGRRFRNAPGERGLVCIEPGVGGRLFESFDTDDGERVVEIGRTRIWQPPQRLVFEWRAERAEVTEGEGTKERGLGSAI